MIVSFVSVIVCTYDRAHHLRETLRAMSQLDVPAECRVEIVVVDNNSTDNTPAVVAEASRWTPFDVVYLQERQQGKSFALNSALAHARGDVLALTDDDVLPAKDWLKRIVEDFRGHDITFAFGKVLPRWGVMPPPELLSRRAQDIWGPLAIVDYGDIAERYRADRTGQRLPIGANVAFAAAAIKSIGGWRTDLGKVNNTLIAGEDHEVFMRLRRAGLYSGYYDPAITVRHYVPPSRLTRKYFRKWFFWHGKTQAVMLDELYHLNLDMTRVPRVAGVPRFLYRQGLQQLRRWLGVIGRRDSLEVLIEELRLLQFVGLFVEGWRRQRHTRRNAFSHQPAGEAVKQPQLSGTRVAENG
jgi:glycosyltransferase involved in cell wall biosynthesis